MDLQLRGRRALITGGSKGIGRATAEVLAAEGCDLLLVARTPQPLAQAASEIRNRFPVQVDTLAADLSSDKAVQQVSAQAGSIDILVNNAGSIGPGTLTDVDDETWRAAWDLKVFGYISLSRALYPEMSRRPGAVIVNVIGAAGEQLPAKYLAGATGNAALMAFTRALGRSASTSGVRVVGINPGPVETTRLTDRLRPRAAAELGDAERWRELCASMPFGRPATPLEIASAVAFLASPLSAYTSGTVLTIDGGVPPG